MGVRPGIIDMAAVYLLKRGVFFSEDFFFFSFARPLVGGLDSRRVGLGGRGDLEDG